MIFFFFFWSGGRKGLCFSSRGRRGDKKAWGMLSKTLRDIERKKRKKQQGLIKT